MEQTFNERHAREILKPCEIGSYFKIKKRIKKRGVWPKVKRDKTDELNLFRWRPARAFKANKAQEVADTPMLPIPFTAHQLAAFMLEGVGALVSGFYGDYESGPDPASLNAIDEDSNARTAIEQAYAARREAERVVGPQPLALYSAAECAREAWNNANSEANIREGVSDSIPGTDDSRDRRARAVASIAKQDAEMEATALAWKQGYEAWLNAMVRQLQQPAPAQTTATPVAVEPDRDGMEKRRARKPTVEAVALDYMREVYRAGQFQSAAKFHKHLTQTVGATGSPFEMGTGNNSRKLFCPAASSFYDPATLGKIWAKIRSV